jgi:hypothetical protein
LRILQKSKENLFVAHRVYKVQQDKTVLLEQMVKMVLLDRMDIVL